jgi:diguanylate cyclase (GGDEF)-like protein/PAS domain S-box-containing protein
MKPFRNWPIRHKLTALFLVMAATVALSVALPIGVFAYLELRQSMARDLATLAEALARNSTAALTFHDAKAAQDVLEALRAESSVTAACIYSNDGQPFAKYVRHRRATAFVAPIVQNPITRFDRGRLIEFRKIVLDGDTVGTIYIESDLERLNAQFRQSAIAFLVTQLLALLVAAAIASRLQRPISQPLLKLVETASAISQASDYGIRAAPGGSDEFGALVSAFNGMLDQIEQRDQRLRRHREELEEEVESRTSELVVANARLRRAQEKYRAIFEDAVIGIFQATPDGRPLNVNRAFAQLHGYDSAEQFLAEVKNVADDLFVHPSQMYELQRALAENGILRNIELELYRRDRNKRYGLANMRSVRDAEGNLTRIEGTIEDITDRKQAEERVEFLAYYDALTGLPNRSLLQDRLAKALANARRRREKVALLFLDLDRFKIINDSLGHSFGDLLLQQVAERLKDLAREQDTVARIGGDEFLIVLSAFKDVPDAAVAAERIMDAICREFLVQGRRFSVSCSIGIAVFPEHGADNETLIKNADAAMYCAKESGRNAVRFFTEDMNLQVMERLTLEHNLRTALKKQELFLVYQPQMEIATGRVVGMEALLRWRHPELGLIPPDRFIRVAENSALILPIGEWVLRTSCCAARTWHERGLPDVPVAVNVSAVQFRQEGFAELIARVLAETGLPAHCLELELTESLLLSNFDLTFPVLRHLQKMGVKLAIDDFGTGYSSLSYLKQFPVQKLKIDRSFIKAVASNPDDAAITSAVISMGRSLNLRVIAEGVENEEQMSFLRTHLCDEIQGHYFSKPLIFEQVIEKATAAHFHAAVREHTL